MNEHPQLESCDIELQPFDNRRLASLCGRCDEHLRQIEQRLSVEISNRGNAFQISGSSDSILKTVMVLRQLYQQTNSNVSLEPKDVHLTLQQMDQGPPKDSSGNSSDWSKKVKASMTDQEAQERFYLRTPNGDITVRSKNQQKYLHSILRHDINFGVGPAGTGKTFLAVACAVKALELQKVRRIVLVRPVVEAGEHLGFLPGDLAQKIDPYLRPLYDALYEMLGFEKVHKYLEQQIIEIAPLAYMRGRTLNDAFIILDEGQNTSVEQMKMFLTRIGFSSTAVITGDVTQIDLPRGKMSGLKHALEVLKDIQSIGVTYFESQDVVRHPIVQEIINAYEKHYNHNKGDGLKSNDH